MISLNNTIKQLVSQRHILLLQGPIGSFFSYLSGYLGERDCVVHKIHFHAGDAIFYRGDRVMHYRGSKAEWEQHLLAYLDKHQIKAIVLFGEWRPLHQIAIQLAKANNLAIYVFEEGYIRPDYVTLEPIGVNANSQMPRSADYYQSLEIPQLDDPTPVRHRFWRVAGYAILYYSVSLLGAWYYPHYQHHRSMNLITESIAWLRSGWRSIYYHHKERDQLTLLRAPEMDKQYFLVALQVHNDSQILYHSPYQSIEQLITEVTTSFAHHAPKDQRLVFKHHPMDRGYKDYTLLIESLRETHHLAERLIYIHDGYLPNLLKHAKGVITVNSTVGLSALYHHTPVKVLGEAIYDIEGLVSHHSLDDFWNSEEKVNENLYAKFRHQLIERTQINMGFYTPSSYSQLLTYTEEEGREE